MMRENLVAWLFGILWLEHRHISKEEMMVKTKAAWLRPQLGNKHAKPKNGIHNKNPQQQMKAR